MKYSVYFFLCIVLSVASYALADELIVKQSKELVLEKQDVSFGYHYELQDGSYLLLGGAAGISKSGHSIGFPIIVTWNNNQSVLSGYAYSQTGVQSINIEQTRRPLWGFTRLWKLNDTFLSMTQLDWEVDGKVSFKNKKSTIAIFNQDLRAVKFYELNDNDSHRRIYLYPQTQLDSKKLLVIGKQEGENGNKFISILNSELELSKTISLPKECFGKVKYDSLNQRFIAYRSVVSKEIVSMCIIPEDTSKKIQLLNFDRSFQLKDVLVMRDGKILISGNYRNKYKYGWGVLGEEARVLLFDKDLNFISGIELPEIKSNHTANLFDRPDGGFLLVLTLRTGNISPQTKTAILSFDENLSINWSIIKNFTGSQSIRSLKFRGDMSFSSLLTLGLYSPSKPAPMDNMQYRVHKMVSKMDSFLMLDIDKFGGDGSNIMKIYSPKITPLQEEEAKIFTVAKEGIDIQTLQLNINKSDVVVVETKIDLQQRALDRPWPK